jgi:RNA polymerase sigma factor (TIGR02999 family)
MLYDDGAMSDITRILTALDQGDASAAEELLPLVYQELKRVARDRLAREANGQTLQPTALVHEAYLRLVGQGDPGWQNQGHFFAAAAEAMRRILIDNARRKNAARHGGDHKRVELDDQVLAAIEPPADDIIALDDALKRLAAEDPSIARLVELRFFAGLSEEEAAAVLHISRATASRHWTYARAWLHDAMGGGKKG